MQSVAAANHPIHRILGMLRGDGLRAQLLRGGAGSIALKIAHTFLALGATVLLARTLGPEQYGIYAYVMALVTVIAIPAAVGLPQLVVRETARAQAVEQWGLMRGLWRWSNLVVLSCSLGLIVSAAIIVSVVAGRFSSVQLTTFACGLAAVPLIALGNLRGAALRGLRKVVQGQIPEHVLRPGLLILLLSGLLLWPDHDLTAAQAMGLNVVAFAFAFAIGAWLLWRAQPASVKQAMPSYQARPWLISATPLALTAGLQLINSQTDIIMLGFFTSAEEVGIYRVAVQGELLVAFGLKAADLVIAPHCARLYAQGDTKNLQKIAMLSARMILFCTFPIIAIFLVFGKEILIVFFGREFVPAYSVLAILCVGRLFGATMGCVGILLNMTGNEKDTTWGVALAASVNIGLNLILIPQLGMNGAAIATALTVITWNIVLCRKVWVRLGVLSMAVNVSGAKIAT